MYSERAIKIMEDQIIFLREEVRAIRKHNIDTEKYLLKCWADHSASANRQVKAPVSISDLYRLLRKRLRIGKTKVQITMDL